MLHIEYWNPVEKAWNRMKTILFSPFDFSKWAIMGFAGWIAGLHAGGGEGGSWGNYAEGAKKEVTQVSQYWHQHMELFLFIGLAVILFAIPLSLLLAWVNARARFIFLDNVCENRAAFNEPWKRLREQGNSLFLWKLGISALSMLSLILILAICTPMVWPLVQHKTHMLLGIYGVALGALLLILYGLFFGYLQLFVYDFILPIMMKHKLRIRAAWAYFSPTLREHFPKFILYGLVRFLVNLGINSALMVAVVLSCCCLAIPLVIPYVGSVLLLPVFVWVRTISLEFLAQFGSDFSLNEPKEDAEQENEDEDEDKNINNLDEKNDPEIPTVYPERNDYTATD